MTLEDVFARRSMCRAQICAAAAEITSEQVSSVGTNGAVETSLDEDYDAEESSKDGEGEGGEGEEGEGDGYDVSDDFAAGSPYGEETDGEQESDGSAEACAAACGYEDAF